MKTYKIDVEHLVMSTILSMYPTEKVEQNLGLTALLRQDLALTWDDILYLALVVETKAPPVVIFTEDQIRAWLAVSDIIRDINAVPEIEHFEEWPIID